MPTAVLIFYYIFREKEARETSSLDLYANKLANDADLDLGPGETGEQDSGGSA